MKQFKMKQTGSRIMALAVALLMLASVVSYFTLSVEAAPKKKTATARTMIGHAANDEDGDRIGRKPGDQKGNEVGMTKYSYKKGNWSGWGKVIRARDPKVAKKIAKAAIAGSNNDNIGYGQTGPSLYDAASKVGFDLSKVKKKVNCDCVSFAYTCAAYAGVSISTETNDTFKVLTSKRFCAQDKYLQPGDILITDNGKFHHWAIVVKSPNKVKSLAVKTKTPFKKGAYYRVLDTRTVRLGPGDSYLSRPYDTLKPMGKKIAFEDDWWEETLIAEETKVKCLEAKGNWIRTYAGWIKGREGKTYTVRRIK